VLIIPSSWGSQLDGEITSTPCHITSHHWTAPRLHCFPASDRGQPLEDKSHRGPRAAHQA
jgi:hypothetical protein